MTDHNTTTKVVVIGGGYTGTLAANRMQQKTGIDITLVNPRPKFVQPDREILERPGVLETLIASLTEASARAIEEPPWIARQSHAAPLFSLGGSRC